MSGLVTVYHLASTGKNQSIIASFRKRGIVPPAGLIAASKQSNGFFVNSSRAFQEGQARHQKTVPPAAPGKPLLLTVACRPDELSHDFEYDEFAKEALFRYRRALATVPPGALRTPEGHVIRRIAVLERGGKSGLSITLGGGRGGLFVPWEASMPGTAGVAEPGLLETLRDHLAATHGQEYIDAERGLILDAIRRENDRQITSGVSLKLRAGTHPKIVKMERLDKGAWHDIPLVAPPRKSEPPRP